MFPVYHQNNDSPPIENSSPEGYSVAFKDSAKRAIISEAEAFKERLSERSARKALLSGASVVRIDDVIESRNELTSVQNDCKSCKARPHSGSISIAIGGSLFGAGVSSALGLTYFNLVNAPNFAISLIVALMGLLVLVREYFFRPPPR